MDTSAQIKEYREVLEGNRTYVQSKLTQDPNYFVNLSKGQAPKFLLIGCSDSRCPPNELTQTQPGEIFIHRNIANCVIPTDLSVNSVLQFTIEHLKIKNIVVMGHTFCGGVKAAMNQDSVGGMLDLWLNNIKGTLEKIQPIIDAIPDEGEKQTTLAKFHVREQVRNLWKNPIVQKAWQQGTPIMIHGWILRIETGIIEEVEADDTLPSDLAKQYNFKFQGIEAPQKKNIAQQLSDLQKEEIAKHVQQQHP